MYTPNKDAIYHLVHYPYVTHRALLIQDPSIPSIEMIDTDRPDLIEMLTADQSQYYLGIKSETLDLYNKHHIELIRSFGVDI